ncbi:MAG TPA: hypothetical protein VGM88_03465 [Kofleriaceae bacterium]|jgi:hypothetical protein
MRFTIGVALVALGAAGCKKHEGDAGSGSAPAPVAIDAAAAPVPPAPPPPVAGPPTKLTGTKAKPDAAEQVDATAAGASVALKLVTKTTDVARGAGVQVELHVMLAGGGKTWEYDASTDHLPADGDAKKQPKGAETTVAPLSPPRPIADADSIASLDFAKPLLYLAKFKTPDDDAEQFDFAIAHDGDQLLIWRMTGSVSAPDGKAPAWTQIAMIKLAPGATVTTGGTAAPAPAAPPAAPKTGALSPTALDDAIASGPYKGKRPEKRVDTATSQWAVFEVMAPGEAVPGAYDIWRRTAAGLSTKTIELASKSASFDAVTKVDVKDLDGDGIDDAVITTSWEDTFHKGQIQTTQHVEQVYVVGGAERGLVVGATHVIGFTTETNEGPGENPQPGDSIDFQWAVVPGPPPVLHVAIGAQTIQKKRLDGLLRPTDSIVAAGDQPIKFQ